MIEVEVAENRTPMGVNDAMWWTADDGGMRLDASEGGLWSGAFVPPPPRPLFLDEAITSDGLTTCDLCTWAWQGQGRRPFPHSDVTTEVPAGLGWVLTLIIVSIISAAIGAIVMIIVLHCKSRIKKATNIESNVTQSGGDRADKDSSTAAAVGVTENHYTHMACEALYAELERAAAGPAYQNSAYTDGDASAPSSAYYSDLSGTERAYEEVGMSAWPLSPLPAIREGANTLTSDYV